MNGLVNRWMGGWINRFWSGFPDGAVKRVLALNGCSFSLTPVLPS